MAYLHTCRTCAVPSASCEARKALQATLAGHGITSVKHRCGSYRARFSPGDPVLVEARAWIGARSADPEDDEGAPPYCIYRGTFIRMAGPKAIVHVRPGSEAVRGGYSLESLNGFLKSTLFRVKEDPDGEHVDVTECRWCGITPALGQTCGRDPHYTPDRDCLVFQMASTPADGPLEAAKGQSGTNESIVSAQPKDIS